MDAIITLGYYISTLGFLIATIISGLAIKKFGKSAIGSALSYLFVGTATFFVITVFQKLGAEFFGITDASLDIWWHLMFYLALISYYLGLKALVGLGSSDASADQSAGMSAGKVWTIFSVVVLAIMFLIPRAADSIVSAYLASNLSVLGLHHFIAFILSGVVGSYLYTAKKNLGQIGRAIANPMIIAIWSLGFQHVWELLYESWKVVDVTSVTGEGVEKIFLIIAAVCVTYAAWRLKAFAQG